jgi:VWFA-related protein
MIRRRLVAAVLCASALAAVPVVNARVDRSGADGGQAQRSVFRAGVELISVEVAVVDREGRPVIDVPVDAFEVTLDGRRRRVVSATFVSHATDAPAGAPIAPGATPEAPPLPDGIPPRVFLIAIDAASISLSQGKATIDAAAAFVRRADPTDRVGLFTYPTGPRVDPTTNRTSVIAALATVHPLADVTPPGEFNLSSSDLVELARDLTVVRSDEAQRLRGQLCPTDDLMCLQRLDSEVRMSVMNAEGMAQASIGMLDSLMHALAPVPGRKTLVLISGGIVSSDMPGGRPDNHVLGAMAGRTAAESNVTVYTLYVDQEWASGGQAETRISRSGLRNRERDSYLRAKWLNEFSGAAGGTVVKVLTGSGEFAFDRIVQETSAYYVLGVEPAAVDRDGRLHEVRVKARGKDLTVRGRAWVKLPKPGNIATARATTAPAAGPPVSAAAPAAPAPARPLDPQVSDLAVLFDRGDRPAFAARARANTAGQLITDFRTGPPPWPDAPQRTAVFALDLAISALQGGSRFARDEALRLLVDYGVRIRGAAVDDGFECAWLRTEVAGLEGLFAPELTSVMIGRARDRCPSDPHLRLAAAVAAEQQHFQFRAQGTLSPRPGPLTGDLDAESRRVFDLFEAAKAAETRYEATFRQAWLLHRVGRTADGIARMAGVSEPDDPYLVYLGRLLRGQMMSELNDPGAVDVLQSAVTIWPAPHAALVALMAEHVGRGNLDEAARLAERIQTMPVTPVIDPWWIYWLGGVRFYIDRLEALKGRAK